MTEEETDVGCTCPICALERFYFEAMAKKLDAEIMELADD